MSEGPIHQERRATTAVPIPSFRVDDLVREVGVAEPRTVFKVVVTDGVIVTLEDSKGRRCRRWARSLEKATS